MSRFTCVAAEAAIGRRSVLAGASALFAVGAASGGTEAATIFDLVTAEGPGPRANGMAGREVRLVGYLSPSFEPSNLDWRLTESPAMPCQLCGFGHDDDVALAIQPRSGLIPNVLPLHPVAITGRVELDTLRVRLADARIEAL